LGKLVTNRLKSRVAIALDEIITHALLLYSLNAD